MAHIFFLLYVQCKLNLEPPHRDHPPACMVFGGCKRRNEPPNINTCYDVMAKDMQHIHELKIENAENSAPVNLTRVLVLGHT